MRNNIVWSLAVGLGLIYPSEAAAEATDFVGMDTVTTVIEAETATDVVATPADVDSSEPTPTQETTGKDPNAWQFELASYLWASSLSGDVELALNEPVDIDTSFFDILSVLKFAVMEAIEARHGRFVLLGDLMLLKVSETESGPAGFVDAEVDSTTLITNFAAGYRVVDSSSVDVDFFAGGQFTLLDVGVDLSGPLQSVERDGSKTSIGPLIGARAKVPLGGRWGLGLYGDAGGLGLTAHRSWQLMGTVHYDLSDHWRLAAGYRHVSVKADEGNFKLDLRMSGPIFAAIHRF